MDSITTVRPVSPDQRELKVGTPQLQKRFQEISTPVKVESDPDYNVEISQLSKQMKMISEEDQEAEKQITDAIKNKNSVEKDYNYGKSEEELIRERGADIVIGQPYKQQNTSETETQKAENQVLEMQQKLGEYADKRPDVLEDKTPVDSEVEKEYMTPAGRAQQALLDMMQITAELTQKNEEVQEQAEDKIIEKNKEQKEELVRLNDSTSNLSEFDLKKILPAAKKAVEDVDTLVNKIDSLSSESLFDFMAAADELDSEDLEQFFSTTAALEDKTLDSYISTTNELAENGGPNTKKFLQTVSSMETSYHLGETDLDRYLESAAERSGIEKTMFLMGRYMQAFY